MRTDRSELAASGVFPHISKHMTVYSINHPFGRERASPPNSEENRVGKTGCQISVPKSGLGSPAVN